MKNGPKTKRFWRKKVPTEEALQIQCDMEIQPFKESELDDLKDQFDEAYEGNGSLEERMKVLRVKRSLSQTEAWKAFNESMKIVAKRTRELFPDILPEGEQIELRKVFLSDGVTVFLGFGTKFYQSVFAFPLKTLIYSRKS